MPKGQTELPYSVAVTANRITSIIRFFPSHEKALAYCDLITLISEWTNTTANCKVFKETDLLNDITNVPLVPPSETLKAEYESTCRNLGRHR